MTQDLLTNEDIDKLILALADGRCEKGFTEAEVEIVVNWARNIRIGQIMLDFILEGTPEPDRHAVVDIVQRVNVSTFDVAMSVHDDEHVVTAKRRNSDEQ